MPPAAYWLSVACSGVPPLTVPRRVVPVTCRLSVYQVPRVTVTGARGERGGRAADELLELDGVVGAQGQVVVAGVGLGAGQHGDEAVACR